MSKEELLQAGISALGSGDHARAAGIFAQMVKNDPSSEQAWLLLGMSCSPLDQRDYCFRRVLAINPNNRDAREELGLTQPAPDKAPPWASQTHPIFTASISEKPKLAGSPPVSPFSYNYEDEEPLDPEPDPLPELPLVQPTPSVDQPQKASPTAKKTNTKLILALIFGPTLIACVLAIPILIIFNGVPGFPVLFPTRVPTLAYIPPTPGPTSTPLPPTAVPSPMPTMAYTPLLENNPCPFDIREDPNVSCGYLIVPENRSGDPSHTIKLAYAVFQSTRSNPAEPVLFLQGGPGAEAVMLSADAYSSLVEPFLAERDFIVFDQRGTGLSEPALGCEELTKVYSQDIKGLIPVSTRSLVYSNAFLSCQGLMNAQGVDLNAYTTYASAADLKDLITLLGYQKVNLYGASYGTRLAQVVMRDYPEIVNSAILDSVVPVESNLFSRYPEAMTSGLRTLFDGCAADPQCNAAYPNLETVFWELVKELDANPVEVSTANWETGTLTETVTGSTVMSVVLGSIKQSYLISTAPQTIYRFKNGDFSTLIITQSSLPFAFEGISPGLFISMMCHEHILATTAEQLQAVSTMANIQEFAWLPFYGDADELFKTCKSWGAIGPWEGENAAAISDIPTLIVTGSYDPTTPPLYARQLIPQLSHNFYFEFPNLGHTPTGADSTGCAMDIAVEFLRNPTVDPNRSCMNDLEPVKFLVPYTGTPALSLKTVRANGVSVKIPDDWYFVDDGFYMRNSSPLDITQVGVVRLNISAQDLQDWFSLEAYGYRGLDSAPIEAGQVRANGLTWTLYMSTSHGRPVDIAMADDGYQSLVILMFSNDDEHEALYQTLFLPMVESAR